jgi:LmbE family N-acetylglucosaminyl deacetylase
MLANDQIGRKLILPISAHPDGVEFTNRGRLTRRVNEGWSVSLVICANGVSSAKRVDRENRQYQVHIYRRKQMKK